MSNIRQFLRLVLANLMKEWDEAASRLFSRRLLSRHRETSGLCRVLARLNPQTALASRTSPRERCGP